MHDFSHCYWMPQQNNWRTPGSVVQTIMVGNLGGRSLKQQFPLCRHSGSREMNVGAKAHFLLSIWIPAWGGCFPHFGYISSLRWTGWTIGDTISKRKKQKRKKKEYRILDYPRWSNKVRATNNPWSNPLEGSKYKPNLTLPLEKTNGMAKKYIYILQIWFAKCNSNLFSDEK